MPIGKFLPAKKIDIVEAFKAGEVLNSQLKDEFGMSTQRIYERDAQNNRGQRNM